MSETLMYQRLARHAANVQSFSDPIMFLTRLKMSWEHSLKRLAIIIEMAFRNFMFAKDDEEMTFLPHEPFSGFGCGSPSASINNEPPLLETEPLDSVNLKQLVYEEMPIAGSVAERMKSQRCMMKGSANPLVKQKLVHVGSSSRSTHQKSSPALTKAKAGSFAYLTSSEDEEGIRDASELQTATDCYLIISNVTPPVWMGHLDNELDVELFDLHDRC
ncbi:hypothetical protein Tco_0939221 [Tanacetum coccineum]|uniref:Uncharacterized protein n=1 Tax=Tanacetum coccineum TaxID=301880 RepID=A0ABQ5DJG4_9ASTR